jgi:SAM-dependent methyltransferase
MSTPGKSEAPAQAPTSEMSPPPIYLDARAEFAARFLFGEGLEIGGLHQPLATPAHARVRYVDRMSTDDLRREYAELATWDLVEVDVIDDGERLATIAPESQDFIVANHFLEHCQDPIGTIETHLGKLKPGGVLFYAVPDKRYTFDFRRPVTPLDEMVADYEESPEQSRADHYEEWCRLVFDAVEDGAAERAESDEWVQKAARELESADYSIHFHVWTQAEFLALLLACRDRFDGGFDIEAAARQGIEYVVVLRKRGALPPPPPPPEEPAPPPPPQEPAPAEPLAPIGELDRWKARVRRVASAIRSDVRRWRARP